MKHIQSLCFCVGFGLCTMVSALAGDLAIEVESGAVWFSQNDTRIPGDTGTEFDMLDLTGSGPDPYK